MKPTPISNVIFSSRIPTGWNRLIARVSIFNYRATKFDILRHLFMICSRNREWKLTTNSQYEPNAEHLKMIQDAITRMANNSFSYKAWSIVVATGVAAVYASSSKPVMFLVGIPAALMFWWLDAFHLTVEKRFRRLFEKARKGEVAEFYMIPDMGDRPLLEWIQQFWSKTLLPFHAMVVLFLAVGYCLAKGG